MIVEARGRRYASLNHHERGEAMGPRELVEDVIRRETDGSLTFRIEDDQYSVAAACEIDGRWYSQMWSKQALADNCFAADHGLRRLLAKMNAPAEE